MSSTLDPTVTRLVEIATSPRSGSSTSVSATSSVAAPSAARGNFRLPWVRITPQAHVFKTMPGIPSAFYASAPTRHPSGTQLASNVPSGHTSSTLDLSITPMGGHLSALIVPIAAASSDV